MSEQQATQSAGEVCLRDVADDDVPIFFEHQLDPEANRMVGFTPKDWDAFSAHWTKVRANPTAVTQAIVANGQVAGNIGSWIESGQREVGYWLGREYWGRGVATQALAAFLGLVTDRPLYGVVPKHNIGSRRVLEKCGFAVVGEESEPPDEQGEVFELFVLRLDG